jgi:hypothetical protein
MVVLRGTKPHTGRGDAAAGIWGCVGKEHRQAGPGPPNGRAVVLDVAQGSGLCAGCLGRTETAR